MSQAVVLSWTFSSFALAVTEVTSTQLHTANGSYSSRSYENARRPAQ